MALRSWNQEHLRSRYCFLASMRSYRKDLLTNQELSRQVESQWFSNCVLILAVTHLLHDLALSWAGYGYQCRVCARYIFGQVNTHVRLSLLFSLFSCLWASLWICTDWPNRGISELDHPLPDTVSSSRMGITSGDTPSLSEWHHISFSHWMAAANFVQMNLVVAVANLVVFWAWTI